MDEPVVLWDIDGTLISSSFERRFLADLRRHGHVSLARAAVHALPVWLRNPLGGWHELKLMYLCGEPVESVQSWIETCWKESIKPELYPGVIEAIRQLRSDGVVQVMLSGTPRQLAEPLMKMLELEDVIAAEPEIQDNKYTGRLVAPHPRGKRKADMAGTWLKDHGYGWNQTIAVADHWDDRFLLDQARTSIVVNPDNRLRKHATRNGWTIVDNLTKSSLLTIVRDLASDQLDMVPGNCRSNLGVSKANEET
jgi:HAD superfamily phosphoserine phosphatase-like hydrolase